MLSCKSKYILDNFKEKTVSTNHIHKKQEIKQQIPLCPKLSNTINLQCQFLKKKKKKQASTQSEELLQRNWDLKACNPKEK